MQALLKAVFAGLLMLASGAVAQSATAPVRAWTQEASDLRADPAVRYGVLPNGMRYAILRNATPPGEVSLRLRIDAGSLHEREDQRGLAHFLEHMLFNGTAKVPEGDFVKRLERLGLRLGRDTNASTGVDATTLRLDLPKADAASLGEALFLLRQAADEATLDPQAIDRERRVIQAEERTRATPSSRAGDHVSETVFGDWLASKRRPIGLPQVIASASQAKLAEFYRAFYRPERATLVAVGDFDVEAMEAQIRGGFASWKGEGVAGREPAPGTLSRRGAEAHIFADPGVPGSVSIAWLRPYDARPDTVALRREGFREWIGINILKRRLEQIANGDTPPFVAASASVANSEERGAYTRVNAVFAAGKWREALTAIDGEQRRLVTHGILRSEFDREIAGFRKSTTSSASAAGTRSTRALAGELLSDLAYDRVFTTPADQLARFDQYVNGLTPEQVTTALRPLFKGEGPILHMTSPTPVAEGEAGLLAAYTQSTQTAVAAPVQPTAKRFTYTSFGRPGAIADRREIGSGTGATAIRFANGTRLTVKPTAFKKDEILISVQFGLGRLALPPNTPFPGPLAAAVIGGGLGDLTQDELRQTFAPIISSVGFAAGDESFALSGSTRPADFGTQMRLLAAYLTDPAWRPTAWNRARAMGGTIHDIMETSPGGVLSRDLGVLIASGDGRFHSATRAEIARSRVDEARALLEDVFAEAPLEVVIVGDVTVDEAIRQTAATFGALAPRGPAAPPAPGARTLRFPAPVASPVVRTHKGRADQAAAFIAWPTADFYSDRKRARALGLLVSVMQLRLTDEIREKQGASYSPSVGSTRSTTFTGYGYLSATIQAPPDKLAAFLADAQRIADGLAAAPPTADELERARKPMVAGIDSSRASSNGWWMAALDDIQTDARVAENLATHLPDIEAVTPADLQRLARQYLRADKSWKMVVVPEDKKQLAK